MAEKKLPSSVSERRRWIDPEHRQLSITRQCELLGLPRSSGYYRPLGESVANLELMRRIDELYLDLRDYADGWEAEERLGAYFRFYCHERRHQSLGYGTPAEVYRQRH